MKTKKGFTLIELLIVIAIIGILSAALLPTILNAPGKARDSARILNINKIATAVEEWNTDKGSYPSNAGCIDGSTTGPFGDGAKSYVSDYFSGGNFPVDPSGTRNLTDSGDVVTTCVNAGQYYYTPVDSTYGQYAISTRMELDKSNNSGSAPAAPPADPMSACAATGCTHYTQVQ